MIYFVTSSVDYTGANRVMINYLNILIPNHKVKIILFLSDVERNNEILKKISVPFIVLCNPFELLLYAIKNRNGHYVSFTQKEVKYFHLLSMLVNIAYTPVIQNDEPRSYVKCILKYIYGKYKSIVISERTALQYKLSNYLVINNWISDSFCIINKATTERRFAFVGRVAHQKGLDRVLALIKSDIRLKKIIGKLIVFGDSDEIAYKNNILEQFGDIIDYRGGYNDHSAIINDYDVLIHPSRYEGGNYTLVMLEAMLANKHIICSDLENCERLDNIVYFNLNEPNSFLEALLSLKNKANTRINADIIINQAKFNAKVKLNEHFS